MPYIILLLFNLSCGDSKEVSFEKNNVRFSSPAGWEVVSEKDLENQFVVTLQKDGMTSSGMIRVNCYYDSLSQTEFLAMVQDNFKSSRVYEDLDIKFGAPVKSKYNESDCIVSSFEFDFWGDADRVKFYIVPGNNKIISVMIQEAVKDTKLNKAGFEFFESSFYVD